MTTCEFRVTRAYDFQAAHCLPYVPDGHRCKQLHGHSYKVILELGGITNAVGFIIDFWTVDELFAPLLQMVDHHYLNEVDGLENPTAELIAVWFFTKLEHLLPNNVLLHKVTVFEEPSCSASFGLAHTKEVDVYEALISKEGIDE